MKLQNQSHPSQKEPLSAFTDFIFNHPNATSAFRELMSALAAKSAPRVIIFTGPTGVGKSTLVKAACNRILQQEMAQMEAEKDFVPLVTISAVPPNGAGFSWKDFYIRLLTGQHEPLVDRKLLISRQISFLPDHALGKHMLENSSADTLRRAVEEYCRQRRTKYLVIDEAHHMLLVSNRQRLECQFECLKSLTIQTGVTILLTGTYRLLDILDQSGQLTRRSQVIHFPRYLYQGNENVQNFRKVLGFLEKELSRYVPTRLLDDSKYFYKYSVGCNGILKDWLARCLEHALNENAPMIDAQFADQFALTNNGLTTIIEEALLGEFRLADTGDERLLDLIENGMLFDRGDKPIVAKPRRPGQRNPKRDPVGAVRL